MGPSAPRVASVDGSPYLYRVMFRRAFIPVAALPALLAAVPLAAAAQSGSVLEAERADYENWLRTSPSSPYAAVYHQPLTDDLVLGPGGSVVLQAAPPATLARGRRGLTLDTQDGRRPVPRNRDVALGDWRLRVSGSGNVAVVTVFAPLGDRQVSPPGWFPVASDYTVDGELRPPEEASQKRMLGLDGVEVTASLAGTFEGTVQGEGFALTAYRIPVNGTEEADVTVFFRDRTSGTETYPPGRFVTLQPLGGRRYLLDFNRARNPFCAYNTAFPCPLPWAGNSLDVRIEAGELYDASHE